MGAGSSTFRFGTFEVDLNSGELRKQGVRIKLQEQPFQALVALIERPREVVTRDELQKRLWSGGIVVDFDSGLNKAINRVREALGDDADNPRFIETVPQRGYRFLAQVESPVPAEPPSSTSAPEGVPPDVSVLTRRRRFLAIASGLLAVPIVSIGYRLLPSRQRPIESIAVLPLENLSGNTAQDYFSDGMTDELIGEIARIGSLRVISRTSSMRYKGGARKLLPQIARELNVDAILEGTVVQSGQRVRITAQLIRAQDDRHVFSEQYEGDLTDILALQGDVARAIARQVEIKLTPGEQTSLTRTGPVKPEAYEAYLKGEFFLQKSLPGILKSIEFFKQAIELDPRFAGAHAGLAEALCYAGLFQFQPSAETYPEARVAALKALELDPSSAGAHNALADVKQGYEWNLSAAEAEFKRALQLNPSHLQTRLWYAEHLTRARRYGDAIAESGRAVALDPVSPHSLSNRAMIFFRARRFDEAIRAGQQALDLDPHFVNALWWQGLAYAGKGDHPKSIACLTKGRGMNDGPVFRALLGHVYGRAGDRAKAGTMLEELTMLSQQRYVSPANFAVIYAGLGDADSTFRWLEKAYQTRACQVLELASMMFDSVRSDPRYSDLMKRVGLPV
ncbi:MAG: winged helix-turn-helix domain-containing protein [Acidobacteriia bacterium]|nr:winged helix-turn-helix domain-containing protein [Terriglobia bacterium]